MINHPLTKLGTKDSKIVQNLVHEIVQKNGPKNSPMVQSIFYPMPARGQLRINFTRIFKVFITLPESRSDEGNLENFENAREINP